MDIQICSYNCCSVVNNIDVVRELTAREIDIIFLQETFITDDKLGLFDFVDENYESVAEGAVYSEKAIATAAGRPQGGIACLWRSGSSFNIDKIVLEKNICILCITVGTFKIVLVNLYFNSVLWEMETQTEYLENLSKLEGILADFNFNAIYFMGDFNADPFRGRAWDILHEFMVQNNLECFDFKLLGPNTITFTSFDNSHSKWLDHIVGRNCQGAYIKNANVFTDLVGSDHLPLSAVLHVNTQSLNYNNSNAVEGDVIYVDWKNLRIDDLKVIESLALQGMGNFIENDSVLCNRLGCMDKSHLLELKAMYKELVVPVTAGSRQFAKRRRRINKFKVVPGWNRRVKSFHKTARDNYLKWLEKGRERDTDEFINMGNSKREFKKALNQCKVNEKEEIDISISQKYRLKNYSDFWKEVKQKRIIAKKSSIIDGKNLCSDIISIFTQKFLLDDQVDDDDVSGDECRLINHLKAFWETAGKSHIRISAHRIREYCKKINPGIGHDGIYSIFLKTASDEYLNKVAYFMNACFNHCFIPHDVLKGDMNPTIKDVKGNVTDFANYRPVMHASYFLKIFELHILSILEEKIHFNPRQFGFKKGCSTSDACLFLKETIYEYTKNRNIAYVAFIDLSKAFDRVDHFLLGEQLIQENIPPDIILILLNYLRNQAARVCWNEAKGDYVNINKGVRQGGILSPFLFKLYLDKVLGDISEINKGCRLGIM